MIKLILFHQSGFFFQLNVSSAGSKAPPTPSAKKFIRKDFEHDLWRKHEAKIKKDCC